jgi:hypothetical protein
MLVCVYFGDDELVLNVLEVRGQFFVDGCEGFAV